MIAKPVLSGSLKFLDLGELLQVLGANGSTGILKITSKFARSPATVYLQRGNPIDAENGGLRGLDALHSLFGWIEAEFAFTECEVERPTGIEISRMNIILDGLRLLDEGVVERIGPVTYSRMRTSLPLIKGPIVDYVYIVDEEDFKGGQRIFSEGDHGKWIWVVLDGVVELSKNTDKGPVGIVQMGDGAFLGNASSFRLEGGSRGVDAVAVCDCQLGVIDFQRFSNDFTLCSPAYRRLVYSLDKRLRQVTAFAAGLFHNHNPAKALMENRVPFVPHGTGQNYFVITRGDALVVRSTPQGYVPLALLEENDILGCEGLLDLGHEPDAAMILGSKDFQVERMNLRMLENQHKRAASMLKNLVEHLAVCIAVTSQTACKYQKQAATGNG